MDATTSHLLEDGTLLNVSRADGVMIVKIASRSVMQHQAELIKHGVTDLIGPAPKMVVNLAGVAEFSSALLNALIVVERECERHGGKLVICGLSREVRRLLRETQLDRVLNVAPDMNAALAAFDEHRARWPWIRRKAG